MNTQRTTWIGQLPPTVLRGCWFIGCAGRHSVHAVRGGSWWFVMVRGGSWVVVHGNDGLQSPRTQPHYCSLWANPLTRSWTLNGSFHQGPYSIKKHSRVTERPPPMLSNSMLPRSAINRTSPANAFNSGTSFDPLAWRTIEDRPFRALSPVALHSSSISS